MKDEFGMPIISKRGINRFCEGLEAKLDLKDKILQVYRNGDLLEIYQLDNLDDYWNSLEKSWEINFYKGNDGYLLSLYELNNYNENILLPLEIE